MCAYIIIKFQKGLHRKGAVQGCDMYDTIFFDLDGTLTDSAPGILNAVRYALEGAGMPVPPEQELMRFIGPPLTTELQAAFGVDAEEAAELVRQFQVYFRKDGMFENSVYDGVPEMLERVLSTGRRTAVTTSKPEPFARTILDHFGLSKYFTAIVGSELDEKPAPPRPRSWRRPWRCLPRSGRSWSGTAVTT